MALFGLLGGKHKSKSSKRAASSSSIGHDDEYEVLSHEGDTTTAHGGASASSEANPTPATDTTNVAPFTPRAYPEEVIDLNSRTIVMIKPQQEMDSDQYAVFKTFNAATSTTEPTIQPIPGRRRVRIRVSSLRPEDLLVCHSDTEGTLVIRMPVSSEPLKVLKDWGNSICNWEGDYHGLPWAFQSAGFQFASRSDQTSWHSTWRVHVIAKNKKLGPRSGAEDEGYALLQGTFPSLGDAFKAYFAYKIRARWPPKHRLKKTEAGVHGELEYEVHCSRDSRTLETCTKVFARGLMELKYSI